MLGLLLLAAKKHPNKYINNPTVGQLMGDLINLNLTNCQAWFYLIATIKRKYYCFLHFKDEELGYREVKSLIHCYRAN